MQRIIVAAIVTAACCIFAIGQQVPLTPVKPSAPSASVDGLSVTPAQTIPASQEAVVVAAVCAGSVEWEWSAASGKMPQVTKTTSGKTLVVFPTGPDVLTFSAWGDVNGVPTKKATTTVTISGDGKTPPPTPPGKMVKLHATFILPVVLNDDLKKLTTDDFKAKLKEAGIEWHIRQGAKVEPELVEAVAYVGGIPAMIVSDQGGNFMPRASSKVTNTADALKALGIP